MRYISHEIRTPLNTVFLGLKLLSDHLQEAGNFECLGILKDTQQSCFTAIEILNFIQSTLAPFTVQVYYFSIKSFKSNRHHLFTVGLFRREKLEFDSSLNNRYFPKTHNSISMLTLTSLHK